MPTILKSSLVALALCFTFSTSAQTGTAETKTQNANTNTSANTAADTSSTTDSNSTEDKALVNSSEEKTEFGEITGTQKYKITCTNGSDVREITLITQEDSSTGVVYKKFDTVKTMAVAKTDPAYADQVAEKIKGNLETAGFTCATE